MKTLWRSMFGELSVWEALEVSCQYFWGPSCTWMLTYDVTCQARAVLYVYSTHFGCITKSRMEVAVSFWFVFPFSSFDSIAFSFFSNDNATHLPKICNSIPLCSIYHGMFLYPGERIFIKSAEKLIPWLQQTFQSNSFFFSGSLTLKQKWK